MADYDPRTKEKKIRYKVEIDDTTAQLKVRQLVNLQTINLNAMVQQTQPEIYPTGQFYTPQEALQVYGAPVVQGTFAAFTDATRFVKGIATPLVTPGNYQDVLFPGGRYALESSFRRELFHGVFGVGYATGPERWFWQSEKPEWMTEGEYRYQLRHSFARRSRDALIDVLSTAASWGVWSLPGVGLLTGSILSPMIEKAGEGIKEYINYKEDIMDFIRNTQSVGKRVLGRRAISTEDAESLAEMLREEDFSFLETLGLKKKSIKMKDLFEKMAYYDMFSEETQIGEIKDKITKMKDYVVKYAELFHTTREQVLQVAASLHRMGISTPEAIGAELERIRETMATTGLSTEQTLQIMQQGGMMGAQLGYSPMTGQGFMRQNLIFAQQLYEQGYLKPWERPLPFAQQFTSQAFRVASSGLGQAIFMAALNPETGALDEEALNRLTLDNLGDIIAGRIEKGGLRTLAKLKYQLKHREVKPEQVRTVIKRMYDMLSRQTGKDVAEFVIQQMFQDIVSPEQLETYLNDEKWRQAQENARLSAINQQLQREGVNVAFGAFITPTDQIEQSKLDLLENVKPKKVITDANFLAVLTQYAEGKGAKIYVNDPHLKEIVNKYLETQGAGIESYKMMYDEMTQYLKEKGEKPEDIQRTILGAFHAFTHKNYREFMKRELNEQIFGEYGEYKYLSDLSYEYYKSKKVSTEEREQAENLVQRIKSALNDQETIRYLTLVAKRKRKGLSEEELKELQNLERKFLPEKEQTPIERRALSFGSPLRPAPLLKREAVQATYGTDAYEAAISMLAEQYDVRDLADVAKLLSTVEGQILKSPDFLKALTEEGQAHIKDIAKDILSSQAPSAEDIKKWREKGYIKKGETIDLKDLANIYVAVDTEKDTLPSRTRRDHASEETVQILRDMSNKIGELVDYAKTQS